MSNVYIVTAYDFEEEVPTRFAVGCSPIAVRMVMAAEVLGIRAGVCRSETACPPDRTEEELDRAARLTAHLAHLVFPDRGDD